MVGEAQPVVQNEEDVGVREVKIGEGFIQPGTSVRDETVDPPIIERCRIHFSPAQGNAHRQVAGLMKRSHFQLVLFKRQPYLRHGGFLVH